MKITSEQKEKLKKSLTEDEFHRLMSVVNDLPEFLSELNELIISRFDDDDEDTPESEHLQRIYDEIYNQN